MIKMSESKNKTILSNFTFRKVLWLVPIAFLIHLIEEIVFKFWEWESNYIGTDTTFDFFIMFNLILMVLYFVLIILHHFWSNRPTALISLFGFLGVQFHNAIYHLIVTIYYGIYSPGVVSGLVAYIPLNCVLILLAYREKYINRVSGVVIVIVSGVMYWLYYLFFGELVIIIYLIISMIYLIVYYAKSVRSSK